MSCIRKFRSSIFYQPHFFCFFIGTSSCLYIFILYFIKLPFCSCRTTTYLRGSYKRFNPLCCDVHEWFGISPRFSSFYRWGWNYFDGLYKYFCFTNNYYSRYIMVRAYLDYKTKSDYRARFNKY
ncbi:uncharacterized protein DS421_14g466870 [Arachis hypogaea]|nr:uncharacterized protein DS421_14g466870 [Arachis hypogaea]